MFNFAGSFLRLTFLLFAWQSPAAASDHVKQEYCFLAIDDDLAQHKSHLNGYHYPQLVVGTGGLDMYMDDVLKDLYKEENAKKPQPSVAFKARVDFLDSLRTIKNSRFFYVFKGGDLKRKCNEKNFIQHAFCETIIGYYNANKLSQPTVDVMQTVKDFFITANNIPDESVQVELLFPLMSLAPGLPELMPPMDPLRESTLAVASAPAPELLKLSSSSVKKGNSTATYVEKPSAPPLAPDEEPYAEWNNPQPAPAPRAAEAEDPYANWAGQGPAQAPAPAAHAAENTYADWERQVVSRDEAPKLKASILKKKDKKESKQKPVAHAAQPAREARRPAAAQPAREARRPAAQPAREAHRPAAQPAREAHRPAAHAAQPAREAHRPAAQPAREARRPAAHAAQPAREVHRPVAHAVRPARQVPHPVAQPTEMFVDLGEGQMSNDWPPSHSHSLPTLNPFKMHREIRATQEQLHRDMADMPPMDMQGMPHMSFHGFGNSSSSSSFGSGDSSFNW